MHRLAIWAARTSAAIIVIIVVYVYARARASGMWPPSHPWSGMCLLLLSGHIFWQAHSRSRGTPGNRGPLPIIIFMAFSLVSAAFWFWSATLLIQRGS